MRITSTKKDLAEWLKRHGACIYASKRFAGMTFQQAWKLANHSERQWALQRLVCDGAVREHSFYYKRPLGECLHCNPKLLNPAEIGFYDAEE